MIVVDVIGLILATALMFWSMNYSIVAHLSEDDKQSMNYYLLSASLLILGIVIFAFVGGYSGGI